MSITVIVNGAPYTADPPAGQSLLELLRDELGITGPKYGCGEGACGACTVLIGARPVQACQADATGSAGQRITTVEGLTQDGILHPVQQAWLETGAFQCGYCTPGWLVATAALLSRVPHPDDDRIDAELAGHVCRCCTYPRIRQAVHRAAELMEHPDEVALPAAGQGRNAATQPPMPPDMPLDLARTDPASFASAMPEGLLAVVAEPGEPGWGGPDDAWVHIGPDGSITGYTGKVEEGQGTRTALTLLVAEELAVPPASVRLAMADTSVAPFDLGTFGSRSMPHAAPPLRAAAAGAFRLLRAAAAARFGLPEDSLSASNGLLAGPDGAPSASYGDLVTGLHRVDRVPADEPVTQPARWQSAGRPAHAVSAADAVTGTRAFPSDLRLPGMLYGCVLHPPAAGATLLSAATPSAELPGVRVVRDDDFIGVVAPSQQAARTALRAVTADWQLKDGPDVAGLAAYLRDHPGTGEAWSAGSHEETGDVTAALAAAATRIDATYQTAYIAHASLEPRAALARWDAGRLTVWAATSTPFRARRELADALGLPEASVRVIVPDFGGGFGGKHGSVVALEAARLARAVGAPVKVQWSRSDEFTAAYLRPAAVIDLAAGADADGRLTAWSVTNINSGTPGLLTPYVVPHQRAVYQPADSPLAQGSYRALAATANNFARESHLDELAAAAGADPVAYRLRHLDDERLAAVLEAAAEAVGWQEEQPPGTACGIALGREKGGRVATAVRVRVDPDRSVRLLTVVTAVDCGAIVHPDGLLNQVEGAVAMGLGPALFEQITFAGTQITNGSFAQYRVPRLADVPVELSVVLIDQPEQPSAGGGEAPIMAIAPAIANAIARACGVRLRALPMIPDGRVPAAAPGGGRPAA